MAMLRDAGGAGHVAPPLSHENVCPYMATVPPVILKVVCGTAVQAPPGAGSVVTSWVSLGFPAGGKAKDPDFTADPAGGTFSVMVSTVAPATVPGLFL